MPAGTRSWWAPLINVPAAVMPAGAGTAGEGTAGEGTAGDGITRPRAREHPVGVRDAVRRREDSNGHLEPAGNGEEAVAPSQHVAELARPGRRARHDFGHRRDCRRHGHELGRIRGGHERRCRSAGGGDDEPLSDHDSVDVRDAVGGYQRRDCHAIPPSDERQRLAFANLMPNLDGGGARGRYGRRLDRGSDVDHDEREGDCDCR